MSEFEIDGEGWMLSMSSHRGDRGWRDGIMSFIHRNAEIEAKPKNMNQTKRKRCDKRLDLFGICVRITVRCLNRSQLLSLMV